MRLKVKSKKGILARIWRKSTEDKSTLDFNSIKKPTRDFMTKGWVVSFTRLRCLPLNKRIIKALVGGGGDKYTVCGNRDTKIFHTEIQRFPIIRAHKSIALIMQMRLINHFFED